MRPIRLNLGCGGVRIEDSIGVDIVPADSVDVLASVTDLPFHDAAVDEVLAYHILEHVPLERAMFEIARVLKPSGRLRFRIPYGIRGWLACPFHIHPLFPVDFKRWTKAPGIDLQSRPIFRIKQSRISDYHKPNQFDYHIRKHAPRWVRRLVFGAEQPDGRLRLKLPLGLRKECEIVIERKA